MPRGRSLTGTDAFQGGVRIEWGQLAAVGLLDADGDVAAEVGQLGLLVPLLEEPQGFVDHLVFGGKSAIFDEGPDNLLPDA
jgi:hypothetical protein